MHAHPHRSGFSRAPDGHGKGRHQFSQLEVSNTIDHLSIDTILAAVKEIRSADRVYLLSRGLSQLVAKEFALKLQLIGVNVFEDSDPLIMQEITSHVKKKELVIIYSLSGKTPELLKAAENAASLGARIITITCGGPRGKGRAREGSETESKIFLSKGNGRSPRRPPGCFHPAEISICGSSSSTTSRRTNPLSSSIAFAVPQAAARRRASWGDLPCAIAVA
ncbi:MurR/RpiR family transcriptional regulator [Selenomonas sp.]|uniref:MurR/RpiR family transcriptional regulator n=1 Tax=Selenomonas sp. TaxID=2053611 RepID=UPI0039BEDD97